MNSLGLILLRGNEKIDKTKANYFYFWLTKSSKNHGPHT